MNSYYKTSKEDTFEFIDHRNWVGGKWEEFGKLHIDFLSSQGLKPHHKFLDIGCGCLRGGIKLIEYLDENNYYGQDINSYLVNMGYEKEVPNAGLENKIQKNNFCISFDFSLNFKDVKFDMGISQSVFTHLTINHLYGCLLNIKDYFKSDAKFFVTFWIIPEEKNLNDRVLWDGSIVSSHTSDPFHYKRSQIEYIAKDPIISEFWSCDYIGDWNHPRNQKMFCFTKK